MSHVIMVVPCYNEERRIDVAAFLDFARRHRDVQFVLVDDGSTDGTGRLLAELECEDPKSFVAHDLPRNVGKAEAVPGSCRPFVCNPTTWPIGTPTWPRRWRPSCR